MYSYSFADRIEYRPQNHRPNRHVNGDEERNRTHSCVRTNRRAGRSVNLHRFLLFIAFTLLLAFLCGITFGSMLSRAEYADTQTEEMTTFKYYKSITVQDGDSLWSIAAANSSEEYDSLQSYIAEVSFINSLSSTCIHSGSQLLIPYYSTELKN